MAKAPQTGCFFNPVGDGFLPHISLQPGAVAPNGFPRGEAVAKIGSSEPILVTDEESGQKANWRYIRQTYSQAETESLVEVFGFPVTVAYRPHSSSAPSGHLPPGGRYWGCA